MNQSNRMSINTACSSRLARNSSVRPGQMLSVRVADLISKRDRAIAAFRWFCSLAGSSSQILRLKEPYAWLGFSIGKESVIATRTPVVFRLVDHTDIRCHIYVVLVHCRANLTCSGMSPMEVRTGNYSHCFEGTLLLFAGVYSVTEMQYKAVTTRPNLHAPLYI